MTPSASTAPYSKESQHAKPGADRSTRQETALDHSTFTEIRLPLEPLVIRLSILLQKSEQRQSKCIDNFLRCLQQCKKVCQLHSTLKQSNRPQAHPCQLQPKYSGKIPQSSAKLPELLRRHFMGLAVISGALSLPGPQSSVPSPGRSVSSSSIAP